MRVRPTVKIKGFEYECKTPDAAVEAALAWLNAEETAKAISAPRPGNNYFHSLGNWVAFADNGVKVYTQYNWACHSTLQGHRHTGISCVALWFAGGPDEKWKPFIDWLVDDSFATEFVLGKTQNGFVVSADIPAGLLHAIAMVSRAPRMFAPEVFERWNTLVAAGIYPEVAYMAAMNVVHAPGNAIFQVSDNHRAWPCPGLTGMREFMRGEFKSVERPFYRDRRSSLCKRFITSGDLVRDLLTEDKGFAEALAEYRKSMTSDSVYRPPNPFVRQSPGVRPPAYGEVTNDEMYSFVLPYAQKKGHFDV